MKELKIKHRADGSIRDKDKVEYSGADWKDLDGLLTVIDEQLKDHGLELRVGHFGDDNVWVAITKR